MGRDSFVVTSADRFDTQAEAYRLRPAPAFREVRSVPEDLMRVDVAITDPVHENCGVDVVADGTNPVQLILRTQRTYIALLSAEEARQLAAALRITADASSQGPPS